jgi:hypothetical protein
MNFEGCGEMWYLGYSTCFLRVVERIGEVSAVLFLFSLESVISYFPMIILKRKTHLYGFHKITMKSLKVVSQER